MDCNPRTPFQWDWENMFNTKEAEMSKPVLQAEWRVEGIIANGSEYSSGIAPYSGSEMGNGSPRSSISASVDSSAKIGAFKAAEPRVDAVEGLSTNPSKNKELARVENTKTSPLALATEPLIGLKLGKRTYFEDVCVGNSIKNPSPLGSSLTQSTTLVKKSKMVNQKIQAFHCQVEGCNLDLSSSKDYHRKHRVCESHSKCPKVIVAGQECRFCQQCSRFHGLSEFDQKKRSCRRRLSDHNARRRKQQPETISFNSSRLSSSFYDYGQEISFLLNRAPFGQTRPTGGSVPCSFKVSQSKESWIKSTEHRGVDEQLNFTSNELQNTYSTLHHDLNRLLPYKGTTAEVLNQGLGTSVAAPSLDGAPDLRRALSLLSTDSWGPPDPGSTPVQSPNTNQHYEIRPAIIHTPNSAAEYWHDERPLFQEANNQFQLLKSPYESAFFDSSQIH